jgi:CRISPR/Cas system CSM-associated protein Csm2 small subunit
MSISLFLSVLLELIFVWFLLSLATMNIQEWMASQLKWRSRMLEKTLGKMLTDTVLLDQFYNHPLIRSLFTGKESKDKPSYIPASQFSQAILDILATTGTEASILQQQLYRLYSATQQISRKKRKEARQKIGLLLGMTRKALVSEAGEDAIAQIIESVKTELTAMENEIPELQEHIKSLFETIVEQKQEINNALIKLALPQENSVNDTVNSIQAGIVALSITHPQLKQTLDAILHTTSQSIGQKESELEMIRLNIEEWFNNSMTRLTGWYKRRTIVTMFVISLLLALIANIDTIHLADRFWHEPELRSLILNQIGSLLSKTDIAASNSSEEWVMIQQQVNASGLPLGWIGGFTLFSDNVPAAYLEINPKNCTLSPNQEDQIFGFWINQHCYQIINAPQFNDEAGWLVKCLGILITAVAASQGAPFWFDLLKKIINVRLSGLNPSETQKSFG